MMRRLLSLSLLLTFSLYLVGFHVLHQLLSERLTSQWQQKAHSNEIAASKLMTRSIPMSLPYRPDQSNFQTFGLTKAIELDGKMFRILKYRYAKDTLHVVYVRDNQGNILRNAYRDWVDSMGQESSPQSMVNFWKVHFSCYVLYGIDYAIQPFLVALSGYGSLAPNGYSPPSLENSVPPPKS